MADLIRIDRTVVRRNILLTLAFDLLLLSVLSGFIAFYRLDDFSFHHVDESTHVRVTQEMRQTGDLWHPMVFGKPYYNKPPFKMWLSLVPVAIFGETNFGFRFIDGVCGILSVLALYLFARSVFRSRTVAFIAAVALITSRAYVFHHGLRNATQDSLANFLNLITVFIGWKICNMLRRESSAYGSARKKVLLYSVASGILIGCAVMTKNVVGFIPLFIIGVFVLLAGDYRSVWKRGKLPVGIIAGIGILIPALYIVPHCMASRGMCSVMLGDEVYTRVTVGYHNRGRPLFYVKHLWYGAGPPPELLIPGILFGLGYWIFRKERRYLLALVWGLAPIAVFSVIPSRLTWYMVPAFPGLALLCGVAFEISLKQCWRRSLYWWRGLNRSLLPAAGFGAYLLLAGAGLETNTFFIVDRILHRHFRLYVDSISEEIYKKPQLKKFELISYKAPELARNERIYQDRLTRREEVDNFETLKAKLNDPNVGYVLTDVAQFPAVAQLKPIVGYRFIAPKTIRKDWIVFISYVPGLTPLETTRESIEFHNDDESALVHGWGGRIKLGRFDARKVNESEAALSFDTNEAHETLPVRIGISAAMVNAAMGTDIKVLVNSTDAGTIHVGGSRFRTYTVDVSPGAFHTPKSIVTFKILSPEAIEKHQFINVKWVLLDVLTGPGIQTQMPPPPEETSAAAGAPEEPVPQEQDESEE